MKRAASPPSSPSLLPPPPPIHTTIIGFGFELDTNLCTSLSSIPFCNFFSVHSSAEFLHDMTWNFDYLVFPIAKNLVVSVGGGGEEEEEKEKEKGEEKEEGGNVKVEKVCGSPESLEGHPEGTLMVLSGMFAAQTQGKDQGSTKGGVVVVKVGVKDPKKPLKLKVRFETHENEVIEVEDEVVFPKWEGKGEGGKGEGEEKWGKFGGEAVRKGVLICRYVEFMKRFLEDMEQRREIPTISKNSGVVWTSKLEEEMKKKVGGGGGGRKVRKNAQVGCLKDYRAVMLEFLEYFKEESVLLDDTELGTWKAKLEQMIPSEEEKK